MRCFVVLLAGLSLGGCATITRGQSEPVGFDSVPSGAEMRLDTGIACVTPCTLELARNRDFIATYSKAGYQPQQLTILREISGRGGLGMAGNVLAGGLVGVGVDAYTGAAQDHYPNPAVVTLVPVGRIEPSPSPPAPAPVARRPRVPTS